ncbi:SagB-type dehydrogenase domain-containing protein [Amphritea atlantica]|uniref:SagB-type dehydrogenase domain-containing protein n=1 Tax=Amphritea atlantica TaxID=355243 RepID=A0A1H9M901_9GAMM|nr:nitroreductase family protein [Amphritea atlantica]SER20144.1 SagB-type dehydrogenase domain-containing protein [Amphritea atlantica]
MSRLTATPPGWQESVDLLSYHQQSKHHLQGYAEGPQTLDWDDQPDPFRRFYDTFFIDLPLLDGDLPVSCAELFVASAEPQPWSLENLSLLLRYSAGLSAWKTMGTDRWSLRTVPSSGNLHPGELYLLLPASTFCKAGLYHYDVYHHRLSLRALLPTYAQGAVYLIQTSILQREAWKYGVRALRYCWLDAGHQRGQCQAVAGLLGWQLHDLSVPRQRLSQLCGLTRPEYIAVEREYPQWICQLNHCVTTTTSDSGVLEKIISSAGTDWSGQPNKLAPDPLQYWPLPFAAAEQLDTAVTPALRFSQQGDLPADFSGAAQDPWKLILSRRSGQAYAPESHYPLSLFQQMMAALQPGASRLLPDQPKIHLLCFVHAVAGLIPGIYLLPRSGHGAQLFQDQLQRWQPWETVELAGVATAWRMKTANTRKAAGQLCCNQPIAANSCFTLIFLTEYEQPPMVLSHGSDCPQLYQEAGILGQQIYLHSTAQGYSGTGIGCFFDDAIHELIGLENHSLQALYGFAVGDPLRDERITQLSGYYHLRERFV